VPYLEFILFRRVGCLLECTHQLARLVSIKPFVFDFIVKELINSVLDFNST